MQRSRKEDTQMRGSKWWVGLLAVVLLLSGAILTACGGDDDDGGADATPAVAANLFVSADIVQGSKNIPEDERAGNACVLRNVFARNSEVVWRARIMDPQTGDQMGDDQIDKLEIQLANGEAIEMEYGPHPRNPPQTFYWTGSWVVPKDSPTGSLDYTIVATAKDGRTGTWEPFAVASSLPTITDEVLADLGE
jgi:hypothetical protein